MHPFFKRGSYSRTIICNGSQPIITFNGIPQTYTTLRLVVSGRDTSTASSSLSIRLRVNGDATSGNYQSTQDGYVSSTTTAAYVTAASTAGVEIGDMPGTLSNANALGVVDILIPNYAGLKFHKIMQSLSSMYRNASPGVLNASYHTTVWNSTAAIRQIELSAGGTAFVDGTTAVLTLH